jgi:hypothetical protein
LGKIKTKGFGSPGYSQQRDSLAASGTAGERPLRNRDGARRYRVAQRVGLREVPVRVATLADEEALETQIIELSVVRNKFLR